MKKLIPLFCSIFALALTSCLEISRVPEHDLYKVRVNTFLNIREAPNKHSSIVGRADNGSYVEVWDMTDGWAYISQNGRPPIGYVKSEYLLFEREGKASRLAREASSAVPDKSDARRGKSQGDIAKTDRSREAAFENVRFIGDKSLLSGLDVDAIADALRQLPDFFFVINAASDVPTGQLFDYAPDLLDEVTEEIDSSLSWWEKLKSWVGAEIPSSNLVLLSLVEDAGREKLLQVECNGNSLKYLKMHEPEKYFRIQMQAISQPSEAIIAMAEAVDQAGKEYNDHYWFMRSQIQSANILENICDSVLAENILPRDSIWHKWVFGWIFDWPFAFANWIFKIFGSLIATLLIFLLLNVGLKYIQIRIASGTSNQKALKYFMILVNFFLWFAMLSTVVYVMPDMTTVEVMARSGYGDRLVGCVNHAFAFSAVSKSWLLVALYILGSVLALGIKPNLCATATLPSVIQMNTYHAQREKVEYFIAQNNLRLNMDVLDNDNEPYKTLAMQYFAAQWGKLFPISIVAFIFSGSLLLLASIYLWTMALGKIVIVAQSCSNFRRRGFYPN